MTPKNAVDRVAHRFLAAQLLRLSFDATELSVEELEQMADFLAGQVSGMDPESVAYGAYVADAATGDNARIVRKLKSRLFLQYRKNLIEWFEVALVSRSNRGGGGPGIKKMTTGIEKWVMDIPEFLRSGRGPKPLADYLHSLEYMVPARLQPVANKIYAVIRADALSAGVLNTTAEQLQQWFYFTWLPGNIDRFSKVFTEYARTKQTSYKFYFSVSNGQVTVRFSRKIDNARDAVEEIRYRYTNTHGREPWLEVVDKFVELVATKNSQELPHVIDRINNLEHSNGMFMEHFPKAVQSWYPGFLNAKYHTPEADELAKYIPDRDLRDLLIGLASRRSRPSDWRLSPPSKNYQAMVKVMQQMEEKINWRKKQYPSYKGSTQIDRFDPAVQAGLDVLQELQSKRKTLLAIDSEKFPQAVQSWNTAYTHALTTTERALESQRKREIKTPGHAAAWEAVHFPQEFLQRFPYSVPGFSKSQLAPFLSRY